MNGQLFIFRCSNLKLSDFVYKKECSVMKEKMLESARNAMQDKDFLAALNFYREYYAAATEDSEKAIISAEMSWACYYLGKFTEAVKYSENVLKLDEDYQAKSELYRLQGYSYQALGQEKLAEKIMNLSLDLDNESEGQQFVKYNLGRLYFTNGEYDLALPLLQEITPFFEQKSPEYLQSIYFFSGFIYYYLENLQESKNHFSKILDLEPSNSGKAMASFGFAFIEFKQKNYLAVIELCEKVVEFEPEFFDMESIAFLTAASYFYLGRTDIFTEYFQQILKTYPSGRYIDDLENLKNSIGKN